MHMCIFSLPSSKFLRFRRPADIVDPVAYRRERRFRPSLVSKSDADDAKRQKVVTDVTIGDMRALPLSVDRYIARGDAIIHSGPVRSNSRLFFFYSELSTYNFQFRKLVP